MAVSRLQFPTFFNMSASQGVVGLVEDLGLVYTTKSYSLDVSAEGARAYSFESGSLPSGLSLNAATGKIEGTPTGFPDFSSDNIFNFAIRAHSNSGSRVRQFQLNANSVFVGFACFSNGGGVLSGSVPTGYVIKRIDFANYGRPNGTCGSYSPGSCGCNLNLSGFIGQPSFSINVDSVCGDPCQFQAKWAYVQLSYGPA